MSLILGPAGPHPQLLTLPRPASVWLFELLYHDSRYAVIVTFADGATASVTFRAASDDLGPQVSAHMLDLYIERCAADAEKGEGPDAPDELFETMPAGALWACAVVGIDVEATGTQGRLPSTSRHGGVMRAGSATRSSSTSAVAPADRTSPRARRHREARGSGPRRRHASLGADAAEGNASEDTPEELLDGRFVLASARREQHPALPGRPSGERQVRLAIVEHPSEGREGAGRQA